MDEQLLGPLSADETMLALLHSRAEAERLRERERLFSALLESVNSVLWALNWPVSYTHLRAHET